MNRRALAALGALTLWPLAFLFLLTGAAAYAAVFRKGGPPPLLGTLLALNLLTMADLLALLPFYLVHLARTSAVPRERKALWAAALLAASLLAMPVYWYFYLWSSPGEEAR